MKRLIATLAMVCSVAVFAVDIDALRKKAESGDPIAQYKFAQQYLDDDLGDSIFVDYDPKEGVKWLRKAAEQGHVKAQHDLGMVYKIGWYFRVAPRDHREAVKWLQKAAEQGNDSSQFMLGQMYYFGSDAPQNYKKAAKWYRLSAEQGEMAAQNRLARMYYEGEGVPKDYLTAYAWSNIALANGWEDAKKLHDFLSYQLPPSAILEAQTLSRRMIKENPKLMGEELVGRANP